MDMIREFMGRPKATITKTEYMTRAKALGNKAKGIMVSTADRVGKTPAVTGHQTHVP